MAAIPSISRSVSSLKHLLLFGVSSFLIVISLSFFPISKYPVLVSGIVHVKASNGDISSGAHPVLPILDRLSLSLFCAIQSASNNLNQTRCNYDALQSLAVAPTIIPESTVPTPVTTPTHSSESDVVSPVGSIQNISNKETTLPQSIVTYVTKYIGVQGPKGEDGKNGTDGKSATQADYVIRSDSNLNVPIGFGAYVQPSVGTANVMGFSTISYLKNTTIDLPQINGGVATNVLLNTPTISNSIFQGQTNFSDGANFTGPLTAADLVIERATSTAFFASLFSASKGMFTDVVTTNATTTNLFTTNLAVGNSLVTGNQSVSGMFNVMGTSTLGADVYLNGSVTIGTSSNNMVAIKALVNSDISPAQNKVYDLGSPSFYWRGLYADSISVNSISAGSSTIGGTSNNAFTLNSDNASTDTEDISLVFFRGAVNPNALLRWNATTKRLETNQSFKVQNETPSTGTTTLTVQAGVGQGTTNLFELVSNSGTKLSAFNANGWLGVGTTTPGSMLSVVGTTTLATTTINGLLTVNGNTNVSQGGTLTVGDKVIAPGEIGAGTSTPSGKIAIQSTLANQVSFLIYGTSTQTAPLISVFDNPGSNQNIFSVSATGTTTTKTLNVTGAYTYNGVNLILASTTLNNFFFGNAGNVTSTGANNIATGYGSLGLNTTGNNNTGNGFASLQANTSGSQNTAYGYGSMQNNTSGVNNTALGYVALQFNATGTNNTAVGYGALQFNTSGFNNNAYGYTALQVNSTGQNNSAFGLNALGGNTTGSLNTAVGNSSLNGLVSGTHNNAMGYLAGYGDFSNNNNISVIDNQMLFLGSYASRDASVASTTALNNGIAIGYNSKVFASNQVVLGNDAVTSTLLKGNVGIGTTTPSYKLSVAGDANLSMGSAYRINGAIIAQGSSTLGNYFFGEAGNPTTTGGLNTGIGYQALLNNAAAGNNTAVGTYALKSNTIGTGNSGFGSQALFANVSGIENSAFGQNTLVANLASFNSAFGMSALVSNTTGTMNTVVGDSALYYNVTGSNNVGMGYAAGIYLPDGSTKNQASGNSVFIGANTKTGAATSTNEIVIGYTATGAGSNSVTLGSTSIATTILQGNVGIGTTTPGSKLIVQGLGTGSLIHFQTRSSGGPVFSVRDDATVSVGDPAAGRVETNGQGGVISVSGFFNTNTSPRWTIAQTLLGSGAAGMGFGNGSGTFSYVGTNNGATQLRFMTNGLNERMTIDAVGNVGIGTTTPTSLLSVASSTATGATSLFSVGTSTTLFNVLANGNVGIGTTAPVTKLSVTTGNAATSTYDINIDGVKTVGNYAGISFGDSTGGSVFGGIKFKADATSNSSLRFLTWSGAAGGTERMVIQGDGNVGIGTTTPTNKVEIQAGTLADQVNALNVTATLPSSTTTTAKGVNFNITGAGTGNQIQNALSVTLLGGYTGAANTSAIIGTNNSTGQAGTGIGSSFNSPIGVYGVTTNTATVNGIATGVMGSARNSASGGVAIGVAGGAPNSGPKTIGVFGGSSGGTSVRIGGLFALTDAYSVANVDTSAALIADNQGSTTLPIFLARSNSATVFTIDNVGNIGIGTTTPNSQLNLVAAQPAIQLTPSGYAGLYSTFLGVNSSAVGVLQLGNNGLNDIVAGNSAVGGALRFVVNSTSSFPAVTNGTEAMRILNNGSIGIGSTTVSASTKLALYGGAFDLQATSTTGSLGSEMISSTADQDFSSDTGNWTGTNWSIAGGVDTHTAGNNTLTLANGALTSAPVAGNYYQITFDITTTATGTPGVSITFGSAVATPRYGTNLDGSQTSQIVVVKALNASALTITPSNTTWTGTIDNISIKQLTVGSLAQTIRNSDGTPGLEFRSGGTGLTNSFIGVGAGAVNTTANRDSFLGYLSGFSNTTGSNNSFMGYNSGLSNTTGVDNSFMGSQSGANNTNGNFNSFIGYQSGFANTTGSQNSFIGNQSGANNTIGINNSFLGSQSGLSNTTGNNNLFLGANAGFTNVTGSSNSFIGSGSGNKNTTGGNNTFTGANSGLNNTTGAQNSFIGFQAGFANITGGQNSYLGYGAGTTNVTGGNNTLLGYQSGFDIATSSNNTMIGYRAGFGPVSTVTSSNNTLMGYQSGFNMATTTGNLYLGYQSAFNSTLGDFNILLGYNNDLASTTGSNQLNIGNLLYGTSLGINGAASIGNIGIGTSTPASKFVINSVNATDNLFQVSTTTNQQIFTVNNKGNIGIGIFNPTANLHIQGNAGANRFVVESNVSTTTRDIEVASTSIITFGNRFIPTDDFTMRIVPSSSQVQLGASGNIKFTGTSAPLNLVLDSANNSLINQGFDGLNNYIRFGKSTSTYMTFNGSGFTGIGTTTPSYAFMVQGTTTQNVFAVASSSGATLLSVLANGNVGVGTSTPAGLLNVVSSVTAAYITTQNSSNSFIDVGVSGATSAAMDSNNDFVWRTKTFANRGTNTFTSNLMTLTAAGNLGVGTTTPASRFDLWYSTTTTNLDIFRIGTDVGSVNNIKFRIDSSGNMFTDGATTVGTPADVAESYTATEAVDAGTVVAFATTTTAWSAMQGSATSTASSSDIYEVSGVRKAHDQFEAIGIVSTRPGVHLGADIVNGVPVALSGRVPVKVTNENGDIRSGDYLTVSKTRPGYAMKMTSEGKALGRALSDYIQGNDKVMIFVENGYQKVDATGKYATTTGMLTTGNVDLNANGVSILNIKSLASANGSWSIDADGRIVAKMLCLEDVCINKDQLTNILNATGQNGSFNATSTVMSTSTASTTMEGITTGTTTIDGLTTATSTATSTGEVAGVSTSTISAVVVETPSQATSTPSVDAPVSQSDPLVGGI